MDTEAEKAVEALTVAHEYRDCIEDIKRLAADVATQTERLASLYESAGGEDPDLTRVLRGHSQRLASKLHQLRRGFGEMAGGARSVARMAMWERDFRRRRLASEIAATTTEAHAN